MRWLPNVEADGHCQQPDNKSNHLQASSGPWRDDYRYCRRWMDRLLDFPRNPNPAAEGITVKAIGAPKAQKRAGEEEENGVHWGAITSKSSRALPSGMGDIVEPGPPKRQVIYYAFIPRQLRATLTEMVG